MTRYLWLSVPLCCAALWTACGTQSNSCQVSADCFSDEVCESNVCVPKPTGDGGTTVTDAGSGGGAGVTGGGDGARTGGGTATGGGDGTQTGGGDAQTGGGSATGGGTGVDAGTPDCESGTTQPCCSGRGQQTCTSNGTWNACDATVSSEMCNGLDDDCNGTVDNDVLFTMPDGGVAMNVSCSIGVGACSSTGSLACATDGGVECGAAVIQPTTEICDNIDNDCDGQTDEGTKVLCLLDADNDHYAGSSAQQEFCPDTTRAAFGNCPVGYVATSLGDDCNDSDATKYQNLPARPDSDRDGACFGDVESVCSGDDVPSGYRAPGRCGAEDDCAPNNPDKFHILSLAADADGDKRCTSSGADQCVGTTLPSGYRLAAECVASTDCAPNDATAFRSASVRTDADRDTHCIGNSSTQCIGTDSYYAPLKYREVASCATPDDCDDDVDTLYQRLNTMYADADNDSHCSGPAVTKCVGGIGIIPGFKESLWCIDKTDCDDTVASGANVYRTVSLRSDVDRDYYCANDATLYCIGDTLPTNKRISCDGTDCNDANKYAQESCSTDIYSNAYTKICPGTYVTTNWDFSWSCPQGFHTAYAQFVDDNGTDGDNAFYTAESYNVLINTAHSDFTCRTFSSGNDYFKVSAHCVANATAL